MTRMARSEVFDPQEVAIAHLYNRKCRRCFLMGEDQMSGKNFDHRKTWIEEHLKEFSKYFACDLLSFALLSNHIHVILRSRPDIVTTWSDQEVARRWRMLCPHRRNADGSALPPSESEIKSIAGCPVKCQEIRERLSSFSWWMRLLCQRVAMRANREEQESGKFFQDRFRATRLVDEASLLACSAYVDLNIIRAAVAETLEDSDHTSVQKRIEALKNQCAGESDETDAFLAPLPIDELLDPIGPCASSTGKRASDKGFLAMPLVDYLELLDWTARQTVAGKRGMTPADAPPILARLGLDQATWCELVKDLGQLFCNVAGRPECVDSMRSNRTHRRYHLRRRARELLVIAD